MNRVALTVVTLLAMSSSQSCWVHEPGKPVAAHAQLANLCAGLRVYEEDTGAMPADISELFPDYLLEEFLDDPWHRVIEYSPPTTNRPAILRSLGPPGGKTGEILLECDTSPKPSPER